MKPVNSQATPGAKDPQTPRVICVCLFLALAVLAVFGQTAHFAFVDYDDIDYVDSNPMVQKGLSWNGLLWALTYGKIGHWHPLTWLSHMADCQVFGLWAGGHHLVNVAFHGIGAVLLFLVLRKMTGALWRSAFVAAVFAVHPLRAESVAWVSERKDVLCGVFFMLTLRAYVDYARQPSRGRYAAVAGLYGLGLLCKNMLVTLPFVLLLLDYWPLGRMRGIHNSQFTIHNSAGGEQGSQSQSLWELVREKIPLFLLSAGSCVATALVPEKVGSCERVAILQRVGNAFVSCVIYIRQLFFPVGLAVPYPFPPNGQPAWKAGLALVLLAVITAGAVIWRKRRPFLLAGWLWFVGMLVPVIGLVQISYYAHADRYTYLPEIGLAVAVTWAVADWSTGSKRRRVALGGFMAAVIGALAVCAHTQTSYWKDTESLWNRALACDSDNYLARGNLGRLLVDRSKVDEAIVQFKASLQIAPNDVASLNNLGNALCLRGDPDGAIVQFHKALEIAPDYVQALNNLGNALAVKGADEAAIAQYQMALVIQPDYSEAHYDLGHVLLKQGKLDQAAAQFRKALDANPDDPDARYGLGKALILKGDLDGAIACLEKTATLNSDPLAGWNNLGNDFAQKGDWEEAIVCYRQAAKTNPRSPDAFANLGMACFKNGAAQEAVKSWQQALEISPNQANVQNNLAWLLATTPDPLLRDGARAAALATQASQSEGGGNPVMLHTLATAYAAQGSNGLAAATARRALELATTQKKDALAAALQQEIELYETNLPAPNGSR